MASIHPLPVYPRAVPEPSTLVAYAARDIEIAVSDLLRVIQQAETVSEALRLYAVAQTLRDQLDRVTTSALDRADACCGK